MLKDGFMENNYNTQVENDATALFRVMEKRVSSEDMVRINDAYELAKLAHSGQKRKSGLPYIIHPIAVARVVAEELELGANPVIAALLHDVVEDTAYTLDDIRLQFGEDVAFLVDVVTKKKKENYNTSKQIDNYRQILESVKYDVRAILIKLADRLNNMRTLESMRLDKQMKIAGETDYFYAPLANRLGLYMIKTELANLSFRFRCPHDYAEIEASLEKYKEENEEKMADFVATINDTLAKSYIPARCEVVYRTPYSIWRKMRGNDCDFAHVSNKCYVKVIFAVGVEEIEKEVAMRIYSKLTDVFREKPDSVSNYITAPKENGYQSFHVKLLVQSDWVEVYIASERMERKGRLGCTTERTEDNVQSWIQKFNEVLQEMAKQDEETPGSFIKAVEDSFYKDDILVFTPDGKGIILPVGATAIDFAFEIHKEVGLRAKFARINGVLMPLKTRLERGVCVYIQTDNSCKPGEDWLQYVKTFKAKRCLKNYFDELPKPLYDRCPECNPLPGEDVIGFKDRDGRVILHKRDCKHIIRLASHYGDSIVNVDFPEQKEFLYPVTLKIKGIDRDHLLRDLVDCVTERVALSISKLTTETIDGIVYTRINFDVHSFNEVQSVISALYQVDGVDEVARVTM